MSEITVMARATAKPGREKDLEKALRDVVGPTHREAGCLRYVLHRCLENPSVFLVVERWASKKQWDDHLASSHIQTLFAKVPDLVASPPEILSFEMLPEGDAVKGCL